MNKDSNRQYDGFVSVEGGVDSGKSPSILQPNQIAWAVNATVRGGFLASRPGFEKIELTFVDSDTQDNFEDGRFQGAGTYRTRTGRTYLCASINGRFFTVNLNADYLVEDRSISGDLNSPNQLKVWFKQAEYWLILQDNQSRAILWDGSTPRRAAANEVPVGGPMTYGKGRLWVANGTSYVGGDLAWTDDALGAGSIIKFTENTFISEGGAFNVPSQDGSSITALSFAANLDTSLGDGDLLVFTNSDVFAFDAPLDRTTWKDLNYPIQRFALLDYGSYAHDSIARVNGDVFFRSRDGIRSLAYARRDFTARWGNTPISSEVDRALRYDTEHLLYAASAVNFDNRLIMTVQPQFSNHGVYHRGFAVMDFDLISGMGQRFPPAWEGVWTGIRPLQVVKTIVNGTERCFTFALNADNVIELWEITKSAPFDWDGSEDVAVRWNFETRSMGFSSAFESKKLEGADFWLDGMQGTIDITAKYRADQNPCWTTWAYASDCATYKDCATGDECHVPAVLRPQVRNRIALPKPPDDADTLNGTLSRFGGEFQFRFEIAGRCKFKKLRAFTYVDSEDLFGQSRTTTCVTAGDAECQTGCKEQACCDPQDYDYDIENPPPPTPGTSTVVYYGRSINTTLTEAQILALTSVDNGTNAGTYHFGAGLGYIYFAFPSVPTSAQLGDFDVAFAGPSEGYPYGAAPMQYEIVSVNGSAYYVFRSFYELHGTMNIDVT